MFDDLGHHDEIEASCWHVIHLFDPTLARVVALFMKISNQVRVQFCSPEVGLWHIPVLVQEPKKPAVTTAHVEKTNGRSFHFAEPGSHFPSVELEFYRTGL